MPDGTAPRPVPSFIPAPVIVASVAATMGTTSEAMLSKQRLAGLHAARQVATLLFEEFTLLSMVEMGRVFGRGDNGAGRYFLVGARERLAKDTKFHVAYRIARARLVEGL